jgi:hypothetical protein
LVQAKEASQVSRADKLLESMRNSPAGDYRIEDVAAVCRAVGIACVAPSRGSHYRISHPAMPKILTIPARRPVKPVYIRELVAYIDRLGHVNDG